MNIHELVPEAGQGAPRVGVSLLDQLDVDGAMARELIERADAQAGLNRGSSHATQEGSRGGLEEDDSFNENEPWIGVQTGIREQRQVEKCGLILSAALTSWQSI